MRIDKRTFSLLLQISGLVLVGLLFLAVSQGVNAQPPAAAPTPAGSIVRLTMPDPSQILHPAFPKDSEVLHPAFPKDSEIQHPPFPKDSEIRHPAFPKDSEIIRLSIPDASP